jgi:hypothetical protein
MHAKTDYQQRMDNISLFSDIHDEFAILDRAGRLQLPHDMLEKMGVHDNKVRLEYVNNTIVVLPADENKETVASE